MAILLILSIILLMFFAGCANIKKCDVEVTKKVMCRPDGQAVIITPADGS